MSFDGLDTDALQLAMQHCDAQSLLAATDSLSLPRRIHSPGTFLSPPSVPFIFRVSANPASVSPAPVNPASFNPAPATDVVAQS